MPPKRKWSSLWNHFHTEQPDSSKARCIHCRKIISFMGGSRSNLSRHLKSVHPTVPLVHGSDGNASESNQNSQSTVEGQEPNTVSLLVLSSSTTSSITAEEDVAEMTFSTTQGGSAEYMNQQMLLSKSERLDEQLVKMVVKEYHPLSIVEDKEFINFVEMLCPGYKLPCRTTLSSLIPKIYNKTNESVKNLIQHVNAVSITTDGWTSIKQESFTAITAHFIHPQNNKKIKSVLLGCLSHNEKHTAQHLFQLLHSLLQEWNIFEKVVSVTTDNTNNIVAAAQLGKWQHISCYAHSVNFVVQNALKLDFIISILNKVKSIVIYFKKSPLAMEKLQQIQSFPNLKLKQDCLTRWNSTYDMLSRVLELKDAIIDTFAILETDFTETFLNDSEWEAIKQIVEVLELFYEVTKEISADKSVSVSKMYVFTKSMKQYMRIQLEKEDGCHSADVVHFLEDIAENLKRFDILETADILTEATLLDPRFKKFAFSKEETYDKAVMCLYDKLKISNSLGVTIKDEPSVTSNETSKLWNTFDEEYENFKNHVSMTEGQQELQQYLEEPLLERTENPLIWWNDRKNIYPRLYNLMEQRLCIMSTSVPCERIFSKAGQLLNEKRSILSSKNVSQIIFLNYNL